MTDDKESEIEDLEAIALGKTKIAINRSIDIESESKVLLDLIDKRMRFALLSALLLSLLSILIYFMDLFINILVIKFLFPIILIMVSLLLIWDYFIGMNKAQMLRNLINDSSVLREQARFFLNEKFGKLDKQEYITEIKNLEIADNKIKLTREKNQYNLSRRHLVDVDQKIEELKLYGIKKFDISKDDVDIANKKLSKFTALRTCEAWIKFD